MKFVPLLFVDIVSVIVDDVLVRIVLGGFEEGDLFPERLNLVCVLQVNQFSTFHTLVVNVGDLIDLVKPSSNEWPQAIVFVEILSTL